MFYKQQENNLPGLISAATGCRFYERIRMIPFVSLGLANANFLGISQSYISRLEKKIIERLKKEMATMV